MTTKVKDLEHDATPSWHGYNYQGKVGLYVCLALIHEKAITLESDNFFNNISKEFKNYSIEYEWIEDFAIKKCDQYISFHQVKHKKENSFSLYIDAISTIFDKILGRFPETRIPKGEKDYVKTGSNCETQALKQKGFLDENGFILDLSNFSRETEIIKILKSYKLLSEKIFFNGNNNPNPIYVHTPSYVGAPRRTCLFKYKELFFYQDYIKAKYNNFSSQIEEQLSRLNIVIGFEGSNNNLIEGHPLVMDDDKLESATHQLIDKIARKLGYLRPQTKQYYTLLCYKIDQHISERRKSYGQTQPSVLSFLKLIGVFKSEIVEKNDEYHEARCKESVNRAITQYYHRKNISYIPEAYFFDMVEKKALEINKELPFTNLLNLLSPDVIIDDDLDYTNIIAPNNIKDFFLKKFFKLKANQLPIQYNERYIFPSLIRSVDDEAEAIEKAVEITENISVHSKLSQFSEIWYHGNYKAISFLPTPTITCIYNVTSSHNITDTIGEIQDHNITDNFQITMTNQSNLSEE